ncbi:MAG: hypothetical protein H7841_18295, partial [Magnetospirillum sp. WYHS-4]
VTVDLAQGTASGGAGTDSLSNIEDIEGSAHADTLIGDAGDNNFHLAAGHVQAGEVIDGGGYAANGNSLYLTGNNDLRGASLANIQGFGFQGENTHGTVNLSQLTALGGNLTIGSLDGAAGQKLVVKLDGEGWEYAFASGDGIASIILDGSEHSDDLALDPYSYYWWGNTGLIGGSGNDTLVAQDALPVMLGGAGNDILQVSGTSAATHTLGGGSGTDTLLVSGWADIRNAGSFSGVEQIAFTGSSATLYATAAQLADITIDGAGSAVTLGVNDLSGLNLINWGTDDTLILAGGGGDDTLTGTSGDDTLEGGLGNDVIDGGAGHDLAYYIGHPGYVYVDLAAGTASSSNGNDTLSGIEGIVAGNNVRSIVGDAGNNTFDLRSTSPQTLVGGAGTDTVLVRGSFDLTPAWTFNTIEQLKIDAPSTSPSPNVSLLKVQFDALTTIDAGGDMTGASSWIDFDGGSVSNQGAVIKVKGFTDTYVGLNLDASSGKTYQDWGDGPGWTGGHGAVLWLYGTYASTTVNFTGSSVADILSGGSGADILAGGAGDDVLSANSGNDTLTGGTGTDRLLGGAGNDVFQFNTGDVAAGETIIGGTGIDTLRVTADTDFRNATVSGIERIELQGHTVDMTLSQADAGETGGGYLTLVGGTGGDVLRIHADSVNEDFRAQIGGMLSPATLDGTSG